MSQRIIDLDVHVGPPLEVRLAGESYKVPCDIPAPLYLKILHFADLGEQDPDPTLIEELYTELLGLFRVHQPELLSLPVSIRQLVDAVGLIYGSDAETEEDEAPPTPPAGKTKSASSSRTRAKKSASPTS